MKLARVFSNHMVLQRNMPILIWGTSGKAEKIEVRINHSSICMVDIPEGVFSFQIPAQEAAEDVLLEIGDICLEHVDIGEVWVAGGQSNMEFMLKYTEGGEEEIASANDEHLRMYTVGQYSFEGEREAGYKAWNPWDQWFPYVPEHAPEFSAAAVYFAKELRKSGIPVGILNCTWGGTSASAWTKKAYLEADEVLRVYVNEFDEMVAQMDLDRYYQIKNMIRPTMSSPKSRETTSVLLKNTFKPAQLGQMMREMAKNGQKTEKETEDAPEQKNVSDVSDLSIEEMYAVGPGEPNEPGALYENMVREIAGYSVRGVIWYQGETDENKSGIYGRLFGTLIRCWRDEWKQKNTAAVKLPFLFVQLAPFGIWMMNGGENYPALRAQQDTVSKKIPDVYMACISDIGNVYDIHPKNKKTVGERLALLAEKYVYGKSEVMADAPEPGGVTREGDILQISFQNGRGLYKRNEDFSSYNGFSCDEIDEKLLPPVLDGVNGLNVIADGKKLEKAVCEIKDDRLLIHAEELCGAEKIRVEFAQTGFYQVNLYNEADIPMRPFLITV